MTVLADPWTISDLRRTTSVTIAVLSGSIFNLILYGVLTVQIYLYHICFNDHITLKTSIYAIYTAEMIYTALLTYDLICLMLNPLRTAAFTSFMIPICGGIVAILTQAIYAYRIRILTRMIAIPLGIVVIVVAGFVLALILIKLRASFYLVSFVNRFSTLHHSSD
ncbi:hypothetical protein APHAL10511_006677 [Amanita phalloides]|nr:hypothetical protein APHAL10511_006677 [Amanita phalloides]